MEPTQTRTDRAVILLINLLSILLPLALLLGFLWAAQPRALQRNDTALLYTVTLPAVREEYRAGLQADVPVLDAVSKRPIGHLLTYTVEPATTQGYHQRAGRMRLVEYPGHKRVTMTIRAQGKRMAGGYSLAGFTLYQGEGISLRLPNFVGSGSCTGLQAQALS